MNIFELYFKCCDKIRSKIYTIAKMTNTYPIVYSSYRYAMRHKDTEKKYVNYYTARPNPGAGIGHQIANWIAGYWFAKQFGMKYAYLPFSSCHCPNKPNSWDSFLGFGKCEETVEDLKRIGYKIVRVPKFNEDNEEEIAMMKRIFDAYSDRRVIFLAEQDQFYRNQYGVILEIKKKYYSCQERKKEHLIYNSDEINIAIHIRRGDIVQKKGEYNENLAIRWQNNIYFLNVLRNVIDRIDSDRPISIFLFSQGKKEDYSEFEEFNKVHYCLEMSPQESFSHMVMADILITSRSSFSYKPALLSNGIKVCPQKFWHGYPDEDDWILADDEGNLLTSRRIKI